MGAATVGDQSTMQHTHGVVALALRHKRYLAGGPTRLTVAVGRTQCHGLNILFQYFYYSKFEKYKSCTSYSPNFSKLYQVVDNFQRDNFTFGKKLIFPTKFELKIWEVNCI
jgi:hypothetical protein